MKLSEANNLVTIGEKQVPGFIFKKSCPTCNCRQIYHETYDAFFCPQCNLWLESNCRDDSCDFCNERPEKPL